MKIINEIDIGTFHSLDGRHSCYGIANFKPYIITRVHGIMFWTHD